ncbi:hypothetical protein DB347_14915 [Opitutaceae bacterium EW11]|nr:hypothetical protein DB347_14915 [Opitutaceae bacterium EW11]
MPRSFQDWVHWLELGPGAQWIRRLALMLGVLILSTLIGYKQFRGPQTEVTLAQAVVGRQLADGNGYTTLVNYPQSAAWLQAHGQRWSTKPFPELHSAPLYPLAIAAALKLIPTSFRSYFFDTALAPPDGFMPDYLLLGLNVALFWIAAMQTFRLGVALFDRTVAWTAVGGLMLSAPVWAQTVAVNGTPLTMVLLLAAVQLCVRVDRGVSEQAVPIFSLLALGVVCGLLFLADYAAGLAAIPVVVFVWLSFAGERWKAMSAVIAGFLLIASPWCTFMIARTGSPVGLAWQDVALKPDGTAADPAVVKATLSASAPAIDLAKLSNKGLTRLQSAVQQHLWTGGGMLFTAFFVAGFLYRFRDPRVGRLRMVFLGLLVTLLLANAFLDSGTGERQPLAVAAPLIVLFGAGFCAVLIASNDQLAPYARWVLAAVLALQAVPLAKDALEPRRIHFQYPPYYPALFIGMRDEMLRRGGDNPGWMADVPAGAAWYSGLRVWAQPASLREFYTIGVDQPMIALVLSPKTLDRPYFSELGRKPDVATARFGDWYDVYSSLVTGKPAPGFPLSLPQKIADNFYVLIDPLAQPYRRK